MALESKRANFKVYLDVVIVGVVRKFESRMSDSSKIGASRLSFNKFFFVITFKILSSLLNYSNQWPLDGAVVG